MRKNWNGKIKEHGRYHSQLKHTHSFKAENFTIGFNLQPNHHWVEHGASPPPRNEHPQEWYGNSKDLETLPKGRENSIPLPDPLQTENTWWQIYSNWFYNLFLWPYVLLCLRCRRRAVTGITYSFNNIYRRVNTVFLCTEKSGAVTDINIHKWQS